MNLIEKWTENDLRYKNRSSHKTFHYLYIDIRTLIGYIINITLRIFIEVYIQK